MNSHFFQELDFLKSPPNRPLIAINMVSSLDGKITVGGGLKPGSLGSAFDRETMNVIRSHFDAVLAGGNTIRQHPYYLGVPSDLEDWRVKKGLASQPLTILLTKKGNLNPTSPLFSAPPRPPLIFTTIQGSHALPTSIKQKAVVEDRVALENLNDLVTLLHTKYKVNRLLVEGGPSVNFQFFQAKLVDELFITLAPKIIGHKGELTLVMGDQILPQPSTTTLLGNFQHGEELFLRYGLEWN